MFKKEVKSATSRAKSSLRAVQNLKAVVNKQGGSFKYNIIITMSRMLQNNMYKIGRGIIRVNVGGMADVIAWHGVVSAVSNARRASGAIPAGNRIIAKPDKAGDSNVDNNAACVLGK